MLDNTPFPDPSVNQDSKADSTLKPKEANDMLRDENKALNSKFDNELNTNSEKNRHLNSKKGITPCPFLKRRGWCVKGVRCDFKHPRDEVQKYLVPCPFLQKRGFCLKGVRCDFSHSFSYPYRSLPSRPVNNASLLHCFTTIDLLWPHKVRHMGLVTISFPKITLGERVIFNFTRNL